MSERTELRDGANEEASSAAESADAWSDEDWENRGFDPIALLFGRRDDLILCSLVLLVGCLVLFAGLGVVARSSDAGFTYGGAWSGILSQLDATGPAAILVGLAVVANLGAGVAALRLSGSAPFRSISDLVLGGFAVAVVGDTALLFLLGSFGLFGWPELLLIHAALYLALFAVQRRNPGYRLLEGRIHVRLRRPVAWWPLVLALWAGPLIVQLASPAAPFQDILPNHVAPVEHVRAFGSFATLTTSPSPIYGPSRLMLGYIGMLGTFSTLTGLHAVLVDAAFATPLALLVALSLRRVASALFGGSASYWILLTFPLTFTFLHIPDTRGTVMAFPLALYALSCIADELRVIAQWRDAPSPRPDLALTLALAGTVFVHPLIGAFVFATALGALILYPIQLGPRLIPALGGAGIMALPQALTMDGSDAPSYVGFALLALGLCVAFGIAIAIALIVRALGRTDLATIVSEWSFDTAETAGICRVVVVVVSIAALLRITQTHLNLPEDFPEDQINYFARLTALGLLGAVLALLRPQRSWILLGCAVGAGCAAWAAASLVGVSDLAQKAIHYEVPKAVEYWLPVVLALAGAAAISGLWRLRALGPVRPLFVLGFLVVSLYPLTEPVAIGPVTLDTSVVEAPLVDSTLIAEHRGAESLGLALREAELGYWDFFGYPDSRTIIDAPRQEVVDEIRSLEASGQIGPSTRILHIASDFQQWDSVPIGVFTGAIETSISYNPIHNIHTDGGRLLGFEDLGDQLALRPQFVALEPENLGGDTFDMVMNSLNAVGYHKIWSNQQAMIFEAR